MSYYQPDSQWPSAAAAGQTGWDHQTPPPARSGASSTIPREEPAAFSHQIEEVDRAIDNLLKSGKMFGAGGRRESLPNPGPGRKHQDFDGRQSGGANSRPHSMADFSDPRGPHSGGNLQNFYASQRHQSSRGSNEAEQMMQAKRRMAAQRERELRNYHQEQQYNRTVLADMSFTTNKPDRALSPGNMSEDDRRELIARQRSALYGEGSFSEGGSYVDETGATRPGAPSATNGPPNVRGHSPLAYEYGRTPPINPEGGSQPPVEGGQAVGVNDRSRADSNSSPQSNPSANRGPFDAPNQQANRPSSSSPGGSPPRQAAPGTKPGQSTVAPIGTRPSVSAAPSNPALSKRSTTPLPSPLSQGYSVSANEDNNSASTGAPSNPSSAATEGPNVGLSGWGRGGSGVWGNKSGLGVQASVWG